MDLGDGANDYLQLASGSNTLSVAGVERISGSDPNAGPNPPSINDTLTLLNQASGINVDLGMGTNTLNLASGANSFGSLQNIAQLNATSQNDNLTILNFQNTATDAKIDLGAGDDNLTVQNFNFGFGANIVTIDLGAGNDTFGGGSATSPVTIIGGLGADAITATGSFDTFKFTDIDDSAVAGPQDIITNFAANQDSFKFVESAGFQFASSDITFVQGTNFTGDHINSEARVFTDGANNTFLQVDVDANGTADMQMQLVGLIGQLTNANFIIV